MIGNSGKIRKMASPRLKIFFAWNMIEFNGLDIDRIASFLEK